MRLAAILLVLASGLAAAGCATRTVQSRQVGTLQSAPEGLTFIWSAAKPAERNKLVSPYALFAPAPDPFANYDAEHASLGAALRSALQADQALAGSTVVVLPPRHSAQDLADALRAVPSAGAAAVLYPERVVSYCGPGCYAFKIRVNYLSPQSRSIVWTGLLDLPPKTRHSDPFGPLAVDFVTELTAQLREQRLLPGAEAYAPAAAEAAAQRPRAPAPRSREHRKQVPAATGFAQADDASAVPVRPEGRDRYAYYQTLPTPKAFVVSQGGGWWFYFAHTDAMTMALDRCTRDGATCWLYAVDDRVVWDPSPSKRIGRSDQLLDRPAVAPPR